MELASNSGNILQVEFLLAGAEIDVVHLDWQESMEMKDQAFTEIERRAREAVPALSIKHLTYLDDEGDSCTLTRETLIDALSFASSPVEATPIRSLQLHIHSPDIDSPACPYETRDVQECVAESASIMSSQFGNTMSSSAEVHAVSCDNCKIDPILGLRFKSLLHDDFNLCQKCFSSAPRQPLEWVQVAMAPGVDEASCSNSEAREMAVEEELDDSPREIAAELASIAEMQQDIAELTKEVAEIDAAMVNANSSQADEVEKEEKEIEEPEEEAEYEYKEQNEETTDNATIAKEEESQEVVKLINLEGGASVRLILGKCGQTLKGIRIKSGASVVLKPVEGGNFDARIAGTKEQAESAEQMIRDLIVQRVSESDAATVNANTPQVDEAEEELEEEQQQEEEEEIDEEILETETIADEGETQIVAQAIAKTAKELAESALAKAVEDVEREPLEKEEEIFKAGTMLLYQKSEETEELPVTLVKVHYDDHPPYYTIRMPDGREKQTIRSKLAHMRDDVDVQAKEQDRETANVSTEVLQAIENPAVCKKAIERLLHHPSEEVRKLVHASIAQVVAESSECEERQKEANINQVPHSGPAEQELEVVAEAVGTIDENTVVDESVSKNSAKVISSEELVLGIEAWEDAGARGDATNDLEDVVATYQASQVYRIGRMMISATDDLTTGEGVPVSARIQVVNDGECDWPETTTLVHRSGPACDCSCMQLGELKVGEATELSMDLLVPLSCGVGTSRSLSIWTFADSVGGKSFGPALCFEVFWE